MRRRASTSGHQDTGAEAWLPMRGSLLLAGLVLGVAILASVSDATRHPARCAAP